MNYKRMRLLADDEYRRLRDKQVVQYDPELRVASRTQDEIRQLLFDDKIAKSMSVEDRMALLEQKQARLRELLGHVRHSGVVMPEAAPDEPPAPAPEPAPAPAPAPEPPSEKQRMADSIVSGLPEKMRNKARSVMRRLVDNADVTFDARHNLVLGGKRVEGSNIRDLVSSMYVRRKHLPAHSEEFAKALAGMNLPRSLVAQERFAKIMDTSVTLPPPLVASTPRKRSASFHTPKVEQKGKGIVYAARANMFKRKPLMHPRVKALKLYR